MYKLTTDKKSLKDNKRMHVYVTVLYKRLYKILAKMATFPVTEMNVKMVQTGTNQQVSNSLKEHRATSTGMETLGGRLEMLDVEFSILLPYRYLQNKYRGIIFGSFYSFHTLSFRISKLFRPEHH
jgi:hypothetical protein